MSSTFSGSICNLYFIWTGEVEMKVWMRGMRGMAHGFGAAVDVLGGGARQAANGGVLHPARDFGHRVEIALRGDREAGLDHIDAHSVQNVGDFQFFLERHRGAGALLAVAQGGVEYNDAVGVGGRMRFGHVAWS